MPSNSENEKLLAQLLVKSEHIGKRRAITGKYDATLGYAVASRDTLPDVNKVWIRYAEKGAAIPVWNINKVDPEAVNVDVYVKEDAEGELTIVDVINAKVSTAFGNEANAVVPPKPPLSSNTAIEHTAINALRPTLGGGLVVNVKGYNSQYGVFPDTPTDITGESTATSTNRQWVIGYLDTSDLTIKFVNGSEETDLVHNVNSAYAVAIPSGGIGVFAVSTYNGQTSIAANELVDIRPFVLADTNTTYESSDFTHNALTGLQGGTTDEYYHLISSDYTSIGDILGGDLTDIVHDHLDNAGGGLLDADAIGSGTLNTARIPDLAANKITSGQLTTTRGGTGADNSTGAAGQILRRASTNGTFTPAQKVTIGVTNGELRASANDANTPFIAERTDAQASLKVNFAEGDSAWKYEVNGAASYAVGIDDSDSDAFKISYGASDNAAFGTNDFIRLTTGGTFQALIKLTAALFNTNSRQDSIASGANQALFTVGNAEAYLVYSFSNSSTGNYAISAVHSTASGGITVVSISAVGHSHNAAGTSLRVNNGFGSTIAINSTWIKLY